MPSLGLRFTTAALPSCVSMRGMKRRCAATMENRHTPSWRRQPLMPLHGPAPPMMPTLFISNVTSPKLP